MSSTNPYYCMQMQSDKGMHCSFNDQPESRTQCETCHDYERAKAADKANFYRKNPSISMVETGQEDDPLGAIAHICRSLTYGEMIELGRQIYSWSTTEVSGKPIDEEALVKIIHRWSEKYGMDNTGNSSTSNNNSTDDLSGGDRILE